MRVVVASDFEVGSHRAHAINVVKTAGGFARLGHSVSVLCRAVGTAGGHAVSGRLSGPGPISPAELYGEPALDWDLAPPARPGLPEDARQREFARWALPRMHGAGLVYARHFVAGIVAAEAGLTVAIETHAYVGDQNPLLGAALEATRREVGPVAAIVTISDSLRDYYIQRGAEPARVRVVPDGVDLEMFEPPAPHLDPGSCPFARGRAGHVVYAGHLYEYKGIPTLLAAAAELPELGFELVGGTPEDVAATRARAAGLPNVRVHGLRPYRDVSRWLWHADVLVLPPSAKEPSAGWTSPVKLGEYLAAGPPIVASRIPGLEAWVSEPAVRWFEPDRGSDLARTIERAMAESPAEAAVRRIEARRLATRFSYVERARGILSAAVEGSKATVPG